MSHIVIRFATREDSELLATLIRSFADFVSDSCVITPEAINEYLFGVRPTAEALIAEYDGKAEGFAIFFPTFSTFLGRPSLYLEDLYVNQDARGKGIGLALLLYLAELVLERGYCRMDWAVLDWNTSAAEFYNRLGAKVIDEYKIHRLTEDAILNLTRK